MTSLFLGCCLWISDLAMIAWDILVLFISEWCSCVSPIFSLLVWLLSLSSVIIALTVEG